MPTCGKLEAFLGYLEQATIRDFILVRLWVSDRLFLTLPVLGVVEQLGQVMLGFTSAPESFRGSGDVEASSPGSAHNRSSVTSQSLRFV